MSRGQRPGVDEAKQRLARLAEHGPTPFAFTLRRLFPADEACARDRLVGVHAMPRGRQLIFALNRAIL